MLQLSLNHAVEARAIGRDVALRLLDPECVRHAVRLAGQQTAYPDLRQWQSSSVAQGDLGLALMCAGFHQGLPDEAWDVAAHRLLAEGIAETHSETGAATSVFCGLAGAAFVAAQLCNGGQRYRRLLGQLDAALLPEVEAAAQALVTHPGGVAVSRFDAITGLAGTCAYLLSRADEPPVRQALHRVLAALVSLTAAGSEVPRWHTPSHLIIGDSLAERYPAGLLNCGLAHGIPGPLAAMAIALCQGHEVPGLAEAVAHTAHWLVRCRVDDQWGPNWPYAVAVHPNNAMSQNRPSRSGWCYGVPGVARALWLSGRAIGDALLRDLAVEAMVACHRRPAQQRGIDSPAFCHGLAGLLQITLRFASDTGLQVLRAATETLVDQLLDAYDAASPLGYAATEPGGRRVDDPGLLDGAAGVAMVLLAASTDAEPVWDRLFLLS